MSLSRATSPLVVATLLALSGCFSLSRGAAPRQYYVLGSGSQPTAAPAGVAGGPVVGVRAPQVAEYLASPFIVVRNGANRVTFSDFERWGEDLGRSIQRSVARHMEANVPGRRIEIAPWSSGVQPDYLIQLHVLNFEGVAPDGPDSLEGEAHTFVSWEILSSPDEAVLLRGVTEARESGWTVGDFDSLVTLLDAGLAATADDVVAGLESLTAGEAPSETTGP